MIPFSQSRPYKLYGGDCENGIIMITVLYSDYSKLIERKFYVSEIL